jgi:hypothetical protein
VGRLAPLGVGLAACAARVSERAARRIPAAPSAESHHQAQEHDEDEDGWID